MSLLLFELHMVLVCVSISPAKTLHINSSLYIRKSRLKEVMELAPGQQITGAEFRFEPPRVDLSLKLLS